MASTKVVQFEQRRIVGGNGLSLRADFAGDPSAPAVVLLHGGGQTRHSWSGAMRQLVSEGFFALSFDARGHGDSEWSPEGDYSLESLTADLRAVLTTVAGKPALVGASMGGATALYAIGTSAPQIASALVLVDIVPRVDPEGAARIRKFMGANPTGFATLEEAAAAVPHIRDGLRKQGITTPLIGDFHYIGHKLLAEYPACAEALDKYRINPGNVGLAPIGVRSIRSCSPS